VAALVARTESAATRIKDREEALRFRAKEMHRYQPYYAFNAQQVDLIVV
jgi:hypothetical protein